MLIRHRRALRRPRFQFSADRIVVAFVLYSVIILIAIGVLP